MQNRRSEPVFDSRGRSGPMRTAPAADAGGGAGEVPRPGHLSAHPGRDASAGAASTSLVRAGPLLVSSVRDRARRQPDRSTGHASHLPPTTRCGPPVWRSPHTSARAPGTCTDPGGAPHPGTASRPRSSVAAASERASSTPCQLTSDRTRATAAREHEDRCLGLRGLGLQGPGFTGSRDQPAPGPQSSGARAVAVLERELAHSCVLLMAAMSGRPLVAASVRACDVGSRAGISRDGADPSPRRDGRAHARRRSPAVRVVVAAMVPHHCHAAHETRWPRGPSPRHTALDTPRSSELWA